MSLLMQDSRQQKITKLKQPVDGAHLESAPDWGFKLSPQEMVNRQFKNMKVVSKEVYLANRKTNRHQLKCQCQACGQTELVLLSMLFAPQWAGCTSCAAPQWLVRRCKAQQARCTNPLHASYQNYGARGIQFNFQNPRVAAQWVKENLGLPEKISINIHLDRINNNGHYEAGNLRWSTRQENNSHTRRSKYVERFHLFRETYPEIRYSDKTLRNLMGYGLTDAQIIERFQRPSDKPKGMYGTFSIADQEIVSLARGY